MKNFFLISLAALIGLTTYGTSLGAGSSDNDDLGSKEMVDVDYLNGKEEAYNGNYRAAVVYLKKSIENNPESADSYNLLGYSNRKLGIMRKLLLITIKPWKLIPDTRELTNILENCI